jgi:transcriptional regulator with XRE-family HTH domain
MIKHNKLHIEIKREGVNKMKKYGLQIRKLREKHGDTRDELAKKLGLSESGLGKYERGERSIKPEHLEQIAKVYEVPLSYFFGEEGEVPAELKAVGVKWISFIKEMEDKQLTPEQIKATLELIKQINLPKNI